MITQLQKHIFISMLFIATIFLAACGSIDVGVEETAPVVEEQPRQTPTQEASEPAVDEVETPEVVLTARDAALTYLIEIYPEQAPNPGLEWAVIMTTPDDLVGSSSYQFTADGWMISISYPVVAPEDTIYQVIITDSGSGFLWEGTVDASGQVKEAGGHAVVGWMGYVVSAPEGAQYDDYLVLVPEGAGEFGLAGATPEIEGTIVTLRDKEEPGKYANFWGTLTCDAADYGNCQLLVSKARYGQVISDPDPVEGWQGTIHSLDPIEAQFDDYFELDGDYPVQLGIGSAIAENGWPVYKEELASLRDTGKSLSLWGQMICGVPDVNGCQIQVERLEVEGVEVDPYDGWATYTNPAYGFTFRYPPTWSLEEMPDEDLSAEGGPHYGRSVQLNKGHINLYIGYRLLSENVFLGGTGMPAGEAEQRGLVYFLGKETEKTALIYEDKVKNLHYSPMNADDLAFVIRVDDMGYMDYEEVEIPDELQFEVDEILGSFELTPKQGGLVSYSNPTYGFSFQYPSSWTLVEMPDFDTSELGGPHFGRSVQLFKDSTLLFIGYKHPAEDVTWWTGVGAWGDAQSGGTINFLGEELDKTAMVYEGKVNFVWYDTSELVDLALETGGLAFGIRMDPYGYVGTENIPHIPEDIQTEADAILESFVLNDGQ
jgi:hypothetical protein